MPGEPRTVDGDEVWPSFLSHMSGKVEVLLRQPHLSGTKTAGYGSGSYCSL
jgi:hypothetical protein